MKTGYAMIAAALLLSLPAFADDAPRTAPRTRDSMILHRDDTRNMHRSEQGRMNASDPSSPERALGRERAEERHEMKEHRETMGGMGGTSGEEEHRTLRRDTRRLDDDGGRINRRMEMERHERSLER